MEADTDPPLAGDGLVCHSSKRCLDVRCLGIQVQVVYMAVAGKDLIKESQKERTQKKKIGMKVQIWSSAVCVRVIMGVICVSWWTVGNRDSSG